MHTWHAMRFATQPLAGDASDRAELWKGTLGEIGEETVRLVFERRTRIQRAFDREQANEHRELANGDTTETRGESKQDRGSLLLGEPMCIGIPYVHVLVLCDSRWAGLRRRQSRERRG